MKMTREQLREIDERYRLALWYKNLLDTSNGTFMPLFADNHRYLVLMGGGGSGKSIFAGRKVLERVTGEPGHRWLVCRKVARTLRESCFKQLIGQCAGHYPASGFVPNRSDLLIRFPASGGEIIFAGLDDVEKLKSFYNLTGIWIEEASELLEDDFKQLDIRLRGETPYHQQIILSFNPISVNHWLKRRFFDPGNPDPRARTHRSSYKDNRFLDAENIMTLEGFKDTDPYHYSVYCLGEWGVVGRTVFDAARLGARREKLPKPQKEGYFAYEYDGLTISDIRWAEQPGGCVRIYREPEKGLPYVIGGDTAGEGSDKFVGQVIDNITCRQMAVLRHGTDEDLYARQMYCLGKYYNDALIGIETNFSTYPVKELERLGCKKQYVREREDTFDGGIIRSYGVRTDRVTRPVMISGLVQAMRGNEGLVEDETTLDEMLTFVFNEKNQRPEAEAGAHDDCVMALAIAHYIRGQQSMTAEGGPEKTADWTDDMWEDYSNAGLEGQAHLIRIWGRPR